jgi:hypothetical protein
MPINQIRNARFNESMPIIFDGKESFGMWKKPKFLDGRPFEETVEYVVDNTKAGRPDLISDEIYGTPQLYWVVISAMRPMVTTNWPNAGDVLKLPSSSEVYAQL